MDVLTKSLNHRLLSTIFKHEIAHVSRTGTPLSVLIIDVDKFKEINDTWGRNTGDEILHKVLQAFYDSVRSSDYVFCYGGDEFIIVLTEASRNETLRTVERIRGRVEKTKLKAANGEDIVLSLSIGAAMFNGHPNYERLIQIADEAPYIAKRRGRNRVGLWKAGLQMRQDAEIIIKLTDADNATDGIFFPALEQSMMGAVLINENDEVILFSPVAEKLWGHEREEVIGNNIDILTPRDLRPTHSEYVRHNREDGKARVEGMNRESQLEKEDGSKIRTRFALSKVSAEGKVYYLALVRDASVKMAQKGQTRQLIITVDHLDRLMIVLDSERHTVQYNRAFTGMFGCYINEASGTQPDALLNIPEFPIDNRIHS